MKSENRSVALGVLKSEASNPFRSLFFLRERDLGFKLHPLMTFHTPLMKKISPRMLGPS